MRQAGLRSFWGWGYAGAGPNDAQVDGMRTALSAMFGAEIAPAVPEPQLDDIDLPTPRIDAPAALETICSADPSSRASHTYGKGFRDVVRALRRDFSCPPDIVARPRNEADVVAVLDWCSEVNAAAIPYGGGSSVVGGTEARVGDSYQGVVSLDLGELDRVVEIDPASRAARIEAGIFGPALEDALRPQGLTLRHFPQSFEFSTLGGWIATRSGGHYATRATHIDDFVESVRVVAPSGVIETRRLPGSGAGPSPDRLFLGSEGSLGVITEAWMRLQDRPVWRANVSVRFGEFLDACDAARRIVQAGLWPANCRVLDAGEAQTAGAGDGTHSVLIVGFESAQHPVDVLLGQALEHARDAGGAAAEPTVTGPESDAAGTRDGAAGSWRSAFLNAPYMRDALARLGMITETFETAVTWDRFGDFHAVVTQRVRALVEESCGTGRVTCRLTHVYPDGAAPYFTVIAPSRPEVQLEVWDEIKAAAMEVVVASGGTVTHHHAVGRDHRPGYDTQIPGGFRDALAAAKHSLDPAWILNPGVLLDPP